jgi:hypothetical protein
LLGGGRWGEIGLAAVATLFPVALIALGAAHGGRLGAVRWPLAVLAVVLGGGVGAILALHLGWWPGGGPGGVGEGAVADRATAGLAVLLGAVVLAPFALVAAAYAMTFGRSYTQPRCPEPPTEGSGELPTARAGGSVSPAPAGEPPANAAEQAPTTSEPPPGEV